MLNGRILAFNWHELRISAQRLQDWITAKEARGRPLRPVVHLLGNHIEKLPDPGEASFYPYPSLVQERESRLELTSSRRVAGEPVPGGAQAVRIATPTSPEVTQPRGGDRHS